LIEEKINQPKALNLEEIVDNVLQENSKLVNEYLQGKESVKNVIIGKVLSKVKGIYTPEAVINVLNQKLKR
jgi:Asp-tRNA(Asn)/Glu-tRNA(Gln) amidotransferase B subunit